MEMDKILSIDYQRMQATVDIGDITPKIVVIQNGKARLYELPNHGECTVKTHQGKLQHVHLTEKQEFK